MSGATPPPSSGQSGPDFITGPDGTVYRAVTPQSAATGGAQNVSGERHVSAVAGNSTFNRKKGATILLCAVGAAVAFIVLRPHHQPKDPNQLPADAMQVHAVARYEPPPLPRASPAAFSVPAPPPAAPLLHCRRSRQTFKTRWRKSRSIRWKRPGTQACSCTRPAARRP